MSRTPRRWSRSDDLAAATSFYFRRRHYSDVRHGASHPRPSLPPIRKCGCCNSKGASRHVASPLLPRNTTKYLTAPLLQPLVALKKTEEMMQQVSGRSVKDHKKNNNCLILFLRLAKSFISKPTNAAARLFVGVIYKHSIFRARP
ncbi:hypothetical protein O3P69_004445 [Scylla paramamosain]|uniref:Uncharacterized protein n=1 Tax=Scylla paramamosain TaxID=85552 RepID=A0AAW0UFM8_SCYPA